MGLIGSAYLLGCAVGAVMFSVFSLRMGRKRLFGVTLILYILSTLLFSFSAGLGQMLLTRFLTGMAVYSPPVSEAGSISLWMVPGTWAVSSPTPSPSSSIT